MSTFATVDRVEIHVLVDNATDSLSTIPRHAESEFAYLERNGMTELAGDCLCCACHGLSVLVTAMRGGQRHSVLFDAGPEEYAFERNATRLGADLGAVEAIVLSHGHWDHGGGMLKALDLIGARNHGHKVPYYAHPGMFRSRARRSRDGAMFPMKDVPNVEALSAHGAEVHSIREPQVLFDGMFYLSGEIPRVTPFERGLPAHYQKDEAGAWVADPLLVDERFLMVNVAGKGLVIFTACSHAGLINVLTHARATAPGAALHAVLGGFHLAGPNEKIIGETVAAARDFKLSVVAAGHCTGWRAVKAFADALGESVVDPSVVGKRYTF